MKNHLNILPKLASFDLKCVGGCGSAPDTAGGAYDAPPDPLIVRGNAPSALATLYFVSIFTSQFPFRAPPLRNSWIRHCICLFISVTVYIYLPVRVRKA